MPKMARTKRQSKKTVKVVDQGATVETDAWAAKQIAVQTEDGAVLIEWAPSWGETPTVELSTEFDTAKTRDETKPVVIVKGGVQINAVMRKDFRPADLPAGTEYVRDGTLQDQEPDEATRPKSPEPVVTVEQEEPDEAPRSKSPEPDKEPDEANHSRTAQTDDEDAEDPVPSHPLAQDDNPLGPPVGSYALHPEVREVAKSLFYKPNNIGGDVTSEFTVQEIRRFFRLAKEMVVKLERDLAAAEKADSQIGPYTFDFRGTKRAATEEADDTEAVDLENAPAPVAAPVAASKVAAAATGKKTARSSKRTKTGY